MGKDFINIVKKYVFDESIIPGNFDSKSTHIEDFVQDCKDFLKIKSDEEPCDYPECARRKILGDKSTSSKKYLYQAAQVLKALGENSCNWWGNDIKIVYINPEPDTQVREQDNIIYVPLNKILDNIGGKSEINSIQKRVLNTIFKSN